MRILVRARRAVVCSAAALFALAAGCGPVDYTPPTPYITGPESGFVNVPVEFVASFSSELPHGTYIWWHWDDTRYTTSGDTVAQYTYSSTGTYPVHATAIRKVGSNPFADFYPSENSNTCLLRIVDSSAGR